MKNGGKVILDLCGGSGSWSKPYKDAGYTVQLVTLPIHDVRTYRLPPYPIWGVLAAPPCTEFSHALNRHARYRPRDLGAGMEVVNACMRIILQANPRWWALENPLGHLSTILGPPRFQFNPSDFGDPWTKRTCVWGAFAIPRKTPLAQRQLRDVTQLHRNPHLRAMTPPGFANAFYAANQ